MTGIEIKYAGTQFYYYYEVRTHSTHTDRKTDEQTENEYKIMHQQYQLHQLLT